MKKTFFQSLALLMSLMLIAGCGIQGTTEAQTLSKEILQNTSIPGEAGTVTFYIVRHGKTMLNTTDRVQGWSDAVLTPEGEQVIQYAGKGLSDVVFDSAYSSDSGRAIQTAKIILNENSDSNQLELQTDSRFREFNFGSYEGDLNQSMWTDIATSQGKTLEEWQAEGISPRDFANSVALLDQERGIEASNWPAEDYETITTRLKSGLDEVAEIESQNGDSNVLLVSHGLSIGALLDTISPGYLMPTGGLKNGSVTTVTYKDGVYTIDKVNDIDYIETGKAATE